MNRVLARFTVFAATAVVPALFPAGLLAQPIANTVPFRPVTINTPATTPHQSWSGNPVILKGTLTSSKFGTDTFTYDWDPGDGGAHCTGTVTNQYDIECAHTYTGPVGPPSFAANLTITDVTTSQVSAPTNCPLGTTHGTCYYTELFAPPPNLAVEVNSAIDNGLWYLHKEMVHTTSSGGTPIGNWYRCDGSDADACEAGTGVSALDCTAFEDSGFLPTNAVANPYSADVSLCLAGVFDQLTTIAISTVDDLQYGSFNPDSNGNGIGVEHNGYPENYQTGMMLDSIVASGTPGTLVPAGTNLATLTTGLGSGSAGAYLYKDAVIDMVDDYAYCQAPSYSDFGTVAGGGWHYSCQEETGDNSVSQWAAIGIIPARRNASFGAKIPAELNTADQTWLDVSFTQASTNNGYFGYTSNSPIWGPYADTPSGLVQLAMNGLGRGTTDPVGGENLWDSAETFLRDNFGNPQSEGGYYSLKDYYYGMFSFTKAMLLHDNSGTGLLVNPIQFLQSLDDPGTCTAPVPLGSPGSGVGPCYPKIDWYAAQSAAFGGTDPTDGVARTILGNQNADGSWFGQNYDGAQDYFQTAISVIMLNETVSNAVPVACFTVNPAHVASGGIVTLNGGCSTEQNASNTLVSWQWDISGTGAGYTIGPKTPGGPGNPKCTSLPSCVSMQANFFCPNTTLAGKLIYAPFLLDGSKSTNPDQGKTDGTAGAPPSTIISYLWDYTGTCTSFTSASGPQVDATKAFDIPADFGQTFNVCLQVTNNDNLAFPTADLAAGLSSVSSAQVTVQTTTSEACTHCVNTLQGKAKAPTPGVAGNIQLYWTDTNTSVQFPINHYNIYRSTSSTFIPYSQIAGANSNPLLPAVQVPATPGGLLEFTDNGPLVGGTTYYYRVAPATVNDVETCQSNTGIATVELPKGR
jgi:hypothetical protein